MGLRDEAMRQGLGVLPLALCAAALRLFGGPMPSPDPLIEGAREARRSREPGLELLLAAALVNTQIDAKAEDDLARRDGLLDELRALAACLPR